MTQRLDAVTVLGVRHHGPGSARSLVAALSALRPDIVLVEGPPEADSLVALAADAQMKPPVALLGYVPGEPGRASFWPFATFSPEWQAIRYALGAGIPVRFCDLPAAHMLAGHESAAAGGREPEAGAGPRADPVACLAGAAGYDDPERWWEDTVEHCRAGEPAMFAAIAEAIGLLRQQPSPGQPGGTAMDAQREAYMRKTVRAAVKSGYGRVAVVCGAWHAPALLGERPAAHDERVLRGLPKVKAVLTWVPWTYGRLASWSGYGAGVRSPGWYHHLFETVDQPIARWLAMAARVLRDEDVPVSPSHVIEAVRLAEALAALRGRPLAGLEEVTQAAHAVLCQGSDPALELVQRRLVVGERLGTVPAATPMVPVQRDLRDQQRRLRLRPEVAQRDYDLDLRKPGDLGRSHLLHRLALLGVDWGTRQAGQAGRGTFHEFWRLVWRPELDLLLIEASMWGTTVLSAAAGRARSLAVRAESLADLTVLTERCLLAGLAEAMPDLLAAVRERAALDTDVTHLMAALPALVRTARYGDVRATDPGRLADVAREMITRICTGLPVAVTSLDDEAARELRSAIDAVHDAIGLLADPACGRRWEDTLAGLADRDGLAPLLSGRLSRLLLDAGKIGADAAAARMARELSAAVPAARAAAWAEGFLAGSGLLLLHDDGLLGLVDGWLAGLAADSFPAVLPGLRRVFGGFASPERRAIGEKAARLDGSGQPAGRGAGGDDEVDLARAAGAVRAVAAILGLAVPGTDAPEAAVADGAVPERAVPGGAVRDGAGAGTAGTGTAGTGAAGNGAAGNGAAGNGVAVTGR